MYLGLSEQWTMYLEDSSIPNRSFLVECRPLPVAGETLNDKTFMLYDDSSRENCGSLPNQVYPTCQ